MPNINHHEEQITTVLGGGWLFRRYMNSQSSLANAPSMLVTDFELCGGKFDNE
jgi:uridylate kinase